MDLCTVRWVRSRYWVRVVSVPRFQSAARTQYTCDRRRCKFCACRRMVTITVQISWPKSTVMTIEMQADSRDKYIFGTTTAPGSSHSKSRRAEGTTPWSYRMQLSSTQISAQFATGGAPELDFASMVYVRAGAQGVLIAFGGTNVSRAKHHRIRLQLTKCQLA